MAPLLRLMLAPPLLTDAEPSSLDGEDVASSSTLDLEPTPSVDDSSLADVTPSPDNTTDVDGSGSSAIGAADDGGNVPVSWTGGDTTHYDGEDYGYDHECPSYCMENGSEDGGDGFGDDGDYYGDGDAVIDTAPFLRRLLNRFRGHQNVPSSNGGVKTAKTFLTGCTKKLDGRLSPVSHRAHHTATPPAPALPPAPSRARSIAGPAAEVPGNRVPLLRHTPQARSVATICQLLPPTLPPQTVRSRHPAKTIILTPTAPQRLTTRPPPQPRPHLSLPS
jgi:hypothetical protein